MNKLFSLKNISQVSTLALLVFGFIITLIIFVVDSARNEGDKTALQKFVLYIAVMPENLNTIIRKGVEFKSGEVVERSTQIISHKNKQTYTKNDKLFSDNGFLLISAYDETRKVPVISLFDLTSEKTVWQWVPNPEKIVDATPSLKTLKEKGVLPALQSSIFRSQHPLLLKDGSILITSGEGPLVRINKCSEIISTIDRIFHHSIESDGSNIYAPIISIINQNNAIGSLYRDDGFAIVNVDGNILHEESILSILISNGYEALAVGQNAFGDRIHLNDVEPITENDNFVKKGDVLLSARSLSTVALYRPSSKKIIWLKTGPWLAQHDINYLGNGKFSIFGNDVAINGQDILGRRHSNVYIYDMKTDKVTTPYEKFFKDANLSVATQGRSKILSNGDVFIDDGTTLRRVSDKSLLRWNYVGRINDTEVGSLHWSRYLNQSEIFLDWKKNANCPS